MAQWVAKLEGELREHVREAAVRQLRMCFTRLMRGKTGAKLLLWRDQARDAATETKEATLRRRQANFEERLTSEMLVKASNETNTKLGT